MDRFPNTQAALTVFDCPLRSVRYLRLAAGAWIKEHRDYDLGLDVGQVRLHIPIATNPGVAFYLDAQPLRLGAGECWYLDLSLPHWIKNRGVTDRIHLVIDCDLNDWLMEMISEASRSHPVTAGPAMSVGSAAEWERFRRAVLDDLGLQDRLRDTSDRESFIRLATALGRERGFDFNAADVEDALWLANLAWIRRWID